MLVMVPVVRRPPERTALRGAGAQNGKHKLRGPAGFEGFVGKVAVIEAGNREHPNQEKSKGKHHREGACAGHQNQETGQVQCNKREYPYPVKGSGRGIQVI